jgi:hypothetical protein
MLGSQSQQDVRPCGWIVGEENPADAHLGEPLLQQGGDVAIAVTELHDQAPGALLPLLLFFIIVDTLKP